jgi:DNA-binding LytR/AlgR family response regulator
MINVVIIDDEPIARKILLEYCNEIPFIKIVGEYENPLPLMQDNLSSCIDLAFLDIHMPKINGVEYLKTVQNSPCIVFTTAFPQYALEGYDLDVLDYLVKPISFNRFLKTCLKAKDYISLLKREKSITQEDYFFVKNNGRFEKIFLNEVLYLESLQNYIIIHTNRKKILTYITLGGIENHLPPSQFVKIHKSFIVNIEKIMAVEGDTVELDSVSLPIGRTFKENLHTILFDQHLIKR